MEKFIISGGYYQKASDKGKALCDEMIYEVNAQPIKILDCLFGRPKDTWNKKFSSDKDFFSKHIPGVVVEIALTEKFINQINNNDILFFQGSRPEDMIRVLDDIPDWHNHLSGKVIVASSGAASMLSRYFGVGKSSSGSPRLGEGLGILPIKFIPHWRSDHGTNFMADWDGLYQKLLDHKEDLEVVTLSDGEFKLFRID